jgi:protein SFI1
MAIHRISRLATAAAFARWKEQLAYTRQRAGVRHRADRILRRFQNRTVSAAFNAWRDKTRDQKQLRYNLQKLVARWQRLQLAAPFHDWQSSVDEVRGNRRVLRRAMHRMTRVAVAGAFARWKHNFLEAKAQATALVSADRILRRLLNRAITAAFSAW